MLRDRLEVLSQSDEYPFHMPGHKRKMRDVFFKEIVQKDITEITDFDDLHRPAGILKELETLAAQVYHSNHAYALVQGSTLGIQVSMATLCSKGSKVLIQRNSHMSVYHTALLLDLEVDYLWGQESREFSGIWVPSLLEELEEKLQADSNIQAVILTSPDYLGIQIDMEAAIRICQKYSCYLIVDSAHGAHLQFREEYQWIQKGADMVVLSLHKTLPALTQTALLLTGKRVPNEEVRFWLDVFETSSPSYLLLASIESSLEFIQKSSWTEWDERLVDLRKNLKKLKNIHLLEEEDIHYNLDKSKLVFYQLGKGRYLKSQLRDRGHLELEMASTNYCLAMTSPLDTKEGYERLIKTMVLLDQERSMPSLGQYQSSIPIGRKSVLTMLETKNLEKEWIPLDKAQDFISAQMVIAYPPGVPILVAGEQIELELIEYIHSLLSKGINIRGIQDNKIQVVMKRG